MFEMKTTDELVRIASAGGGFRLKASMKTTDELVRIASAASSKKARIVLVGLEFKTVDELVRIASAGGGGVSFESKDESPSER